MRISCAGFPAKRPYPDFVDHFWPLAPDLLRDTRLDDRAIARAIVQRAGTQGHQLGTTKVGGCQGRRSWKKLHARVPRLGGT